MQPAKPVVISPDRESSLPQQQQQQMERGQSRDKSQRGLPRSGPLSMLENKHTRSDVAHTSESASNRPRLQPSVSMLATEDLNLSAPNHHVAPPPAFGRAAHHPEQARIISTPYDSGHSGMSGSHLPFQHASTEGLSKFGDQSHGAAVLADDDAAAAGEQAADALLDEIPADMSWEKAIHPATYSPSHAASHSTLHHGLQSPLAAYSDQEAQHDTPNGLQSPLGAESDLEPQHESPHEQQPGFPDIVSEGLELGDEVAGDRHQFTRLWSNAALAGEACHPSIYPNPFHPLSHVPHQDDDAGHDLVEGLVHDPHVPPGSLDLDLHLPHSLQRHRSLSPKHICPAPASLQAGQVDRKQELAQYNAAPERHVRLGLENAYRHAVGDSGEDHEQGDSPREPADAAGTASAALEESSGSEMQGSSASESRSGTDSGSEEAESSDNMEFATRYCLNCTAASSGTMCLVSALAA